MGKLSPLSTSYPVLGANGQGSWGGKGTKKQKKNPKFLVQTAGIEPAKRKDFQSSNVIITEKKDRKASQFQVKDLPYPYTSIEQYEARFKNPLGSEWNSRATHQKETMPRVTKKVRLTLSLLRIVADESSLGLLSSLSDDYSELHIHLVLLYRLDPVTTHALHRDIQSQ